MEYCWVFIIIRLKTVHRIYLFSTINVLGSLKKKDLSLSTEVSFFNSMAACLKSMQLSCYGYFHTFVGAKAAGIGAELAILVY